jgi:hypothetical protein
MGKLLKNELTRCLYGQKFKILFLGLLGYSLSVFLITVGSVSGKSSIELLSPDQYTMILGVDIRTFLHIFLLMCPLISSIIYADSYIYEKEKGIVNYYKTRIGFMKFIAAKLAAVIFINFITIFIIISINTLLTWIAVPNIGVRSKYGLPVYHIINAQNDMFLKPLYNKSALSYIFMITIIIALYHALIGIYALGLSIVLKSVKKINLYIYVFIGASILAILLPIKFEISMYAQTYPGKLSDFILTFAGWLLGGIILMTISLCVERKR